MKVKILEDYGSVDYSDRNTKLNSQIFDKQDLFDSVFELLTSKGIEVDDFKGNISYDEDEGFGDVPGEFYVTCDFEWIMYDDPKNFISTSEKVEDIVRDTFESCDEVSCVRYRGGSSYSDDGYDVSLNIRLSYPLDSQ